MTDSESASDDLLHPPLQGAESVPSTSAGLRSKLNESQTSASATGGGQDKFRKELLEVVKQREELRERLARLEYEIYEAEGIFLTRTDTPWSILKGWNISENRSPPSPGGSKTVPTKRKSKEFNCSEKTSLKKNFKQSDRLFTRSSVTAMESVSKCMGGNGKKATGTMDTKGIAAFSGGTGGPCKSGRGQGVIRMGGFLRKEGDGSAYSHPNVETSESTYSSSD